MKKNGIKKKFIIDNINNLIKKNTYIEKTNLSFDEPLERNNIENNNIEKKLNINPNIKPNESGIKIDFKKESSDDKKISKKRIYV